MHRTGNQATFSASVAVLPSCTFGPWQLYTPYIACSSNRYECSTGAFTCKSKVFQAGTTYYIAIGSMRAGAGSTGSGTLTISRRTGTCTYPEALSVGNNVFADARDELYHIPNDPIIWPMTSGVTLSYPAGACGAAAVTSYNAIYLSFTPTVTGSYKFSTCDMAK